jgi:hypothetical protein
MSGHFTPNIQIEIIWIGGKVKKIDKGPFYASIRVGALPILTSLAEFIKGQTLNMPTSQQATSKRTRTSQECIPQRKGRSLPWSHGGKVYVFRLDEEYNSLMKEPWSNTAPSSSHEKSRSCSAISLVPPASPSFAPIHSNKHSSQIPVQESSFVEATDCYSTLPSKPWVPIGFVKSSTAGILEV